MEIKKTSIIDNNDSLMELILVLEGEQQFLPLIMEW